MAAAIEQNGDTPLSIVDEKETNHKTDERAEKKADRKTMMMEEHEPGTEQRNCANHL